MEGPYPDWKLLPSEVLLKIFQSETTETVQHPPTAALVCKAWKNPAQLALYSHVKINSIQQFEKFYDVLKHNPYFGSKVKKLDLRIHHEHEYYQQEENFILIHLLFDYLPNLEAFNERFRCSYEPIIHALQNSKLKYLMIIPPFRYRINVDDGTQYASCAFLIRNRIEKVYIDTDPASDLDKSSITKFQQLYDNLSQFNKLTDIEIKRRTSDGVQVLEHIVESCRSLRNIKIKILSINDRNYSVQLKKMTSIKTMPCYTPITNINKLDIRLYTSSLEACKILLYIAQKFPKLQKLCISCDQKAQVTSYVFNQFLNYVLTINNVYAPYLVISQSGTTGVNESLLTTVSNLTNAEDVKLIYDCRRHNNKTLYDVKKEGKEIEFKVTSYLQTPDWQPCIDFIQKNGIPVGNLKLSFCEVGNLPHENSLIDIFMHCPSLQKLYITRFFLKKSAQSKIDSNNKHFIDEIELNYCKLKPGVLEQLSTILSEINQLQLCHTISHNRKENDDVIRINMPYTRITNISVRGPGSSKLAYVRIFVVPDSKYYYYRFDCSVAGEQINAMEFEKVNDVEVMKDQDDNEDAEKDDDTDIIGMYNVYNKPLFVFIYCQTKPKVKIY